MSAILQDKLTLNIRLKITFAVAGVYMNGICIGELNLIYILNEFFSAVVLLND